MGYDCLQNLCVEDYEYPGEKNAFAVLKKIPILDKVTGAYLKYISQLAIVPEQQGDFYRVTEKTCPEIYKLYKTALKRLDISEEYPLYIKAEYNSAAGLIKSAWRYEGDKWIWEFTIPEGAKATVTLPGETESKEYGSGTHKIEK